MTLRTDGGAVAPAAASAAAGASYRTARLNKVFPGVHALRDVSVEVRKGEIHGVVGKNGAGKSVLMSVLAGVLPATSGEIHIGDKAINTRHYSTSVAHSLGVALIPQEPAFARQMSVEDNLFIGSGLTRAGGFVDRGRLRPQALAVMEQLGVRGRPELRLDALRIEDQQLLAFGKALLIDRASVILLDEITASLPRHRKTALLGFLREEVGRSPDLSFTLITHHIDEVMEFCDRVTVMRNGEAVGPFVVKDTTKAALADAITGGVPVVRVGDVGEHRVRTNGKAPIMAVEGLASPGSFEDVTFELRGGEVVGLAGLETTSGKDALLPSLVGLAPVSTGTVRLRGATVNLSSPSAARRLGVVYLPKKREEEATISGTSVLDNLLISIYSDLRNRLGFLDAAKGRRIGERCTDEYKIKTPSVDARIDSLSGGNRQKVMLARLLNTVPSVLLLDEPTRGVDLSAKPEIMRSIRESLTDDRTVLLTSESEDELVDVCDRILVIYRGRLVKSLSKGQPDFSPASVYRAMQGVDVGRPA